MRFSSRWESALLSSAKHDRVLSSLATLGMLGVKMKIAAAPASPAKPVIEERTAEEQRAKEAALVCATLCPPALLLAYSTLFRHIVLHKYPYF